MLEREQQILPRRQRRDEVELLKDEPDAAPPDAVASGFGQRVEVLPVQRDGAGVRPEQAREHVEQRRLAAAAAAEQQVVLAALDLEMRERQHVYAFVRMAEVARGENGRRHARVVMSFSTQSGQSSQDSAGIFWSAFGPRPRSKTGR